MNTVVSTEQGAVLGLLETLLANSPVGFCFLDEDLRYVGVNDSFAAMNGQAPTQLLGRTVREETPEFALMAETALRRVLKSGKPVLDIELKFAPSASRTEIQYALASFFPVLGSIGKVASIGVMVLDITDRRVADLRIRESEEKYRLLFEHSPTPIFVVHPDTSRFLAVNEAAIRSYGYSREEFLSMNVCTLRPNGNTPAFLRDYTNTTDPLTETKLSREGELHHRRKDGGIIEVEINWSPISFRGIYAHLVLAHDITERKRAGEKLRQLSYELARSNTALQQFASVASHDLREPLRTMGMFADILKRKSADKLDREELGYLAFIADNARRMMELTSDLLRYSEVGAKGPGTRPVDLNSVLNTTLMNLKVAIDESTTKVTHDVLPTVSGDFIQLTQLFQNLIANAIKYCRIGGKPEVHISAKRRDSDWLISVKDNGIGFEMRHAKEIFEPFRRLHEHSEFRGSGLGLPTCKRIVEMHGGLIWAESNPGQGACFCFSLPRIAERESGRA